MRIPAPLLLILPYIASLGCFGGPTSYAPYRLTISSPAIGVALGETANVSVAVSATTHEDYGGCGTGPELPTVSVDRVTCAPDCVVSDEHSTSFTVTAGNGGRKTVEIFTSTSDGKSESQNVSIDFREVTRIEAGRDATSPSGTLYGMFPGDDQQWSLHVGDAQGPLLADLCKLQVEGDSAIEAKARCFSPAPGDSIDGLLGATVHATYSGAGSVTMRFGNVVRSERIVVIDPATVRRAELLVVAPGTPASVDQMTSTTALPDPLVFRYKCNGTSNPLVVLRVETLDGMIAFGGTQHLRSEPLAAVLFTSVEQSARIKLGQVLDGTIRADFGANGDTPLTLPYVVRAGCPDSDGDPTDAGPPDGGDAADAANDADAVDAGADASDGGE